MKKVLLTIALATITCGLFAQGRVNFANNTLAGSQIITNGLGAPGVGSGNISGPSGSFRFELFAAADGTSDVSLFTTTGITNANSSVLGAGRISNRNSVDPLRGAQGTWIQVQVRGWSANLGGTWAEAYANSQSAPFLAGLGTQLAWISDYENTARTPIGRVQLAGTSVNGPTIFLSSVAPAAGTVQISGLELTLVPEPSTIALGLMGIGATLVLIRRRK